MKGKDGQETLEKLIDHFAKQEGASVCPKEEQNSLVDLAG